MKTIYAKEDDGQFSEYKFPDNWIPKGMYYVVKNEWLYELRQTRFFPDNLSHSWDICAVARSVDEMKRMTKDFKGGIDYSLVE